MRKIYTQEELAKVIAQEHCRRLGLSYSTKTTVSFYYETGKDGMPYLDRVSVEEVR